MSTLDTIAGAPDPGRQNGAGSNAELTIEQRAVEGLSQGQIVRRRFFRHRGAMISLAVLILVVLLVFTSVGVQVPIPTFTSGGFAFQGIHIPGWWHYHWESIDVVEEGGNPTLRGLFDWGNHPFGQDEVGRDIFARVMRGTQQSLTVMVLYGGIAAVLGVVIGGLAGYFRGWLDALLMRVTDLFLVVPVLVFAAVLGRIAGDNPVTAAFGAVSLGLVLGFVGWMSLARLVRGEFLTLREREFVDAARVAGASAGRIIFRHILPNAIGVVIVSTTLIMSAAIILEANLSFLGFGIQAPDVSLGQLVQEYQGAFATRPWLFWFPGFFIVVIALCINFIGDGLRDAFDPRQRRMPGSGGWARLRGAWLAQPAVPAGAGASSDATDTPSRADTGGGTVAGTDGEAPR